jgi:putative inorganic carbon (hco3(-)) transporter
MMLRAYLDRPQAFWGVLAAQIAVLAIQGLISAMQYFMNFVLPFPVGGMAGGSVHVDMIGNEMIQRVSGLLGHCNTFSAYLSVACAICLIAMFARIKPWMRAAVIPFLISGILSLVLTFSRNGWLAFVFNAVGISVWALYTRRLKIRMIAAMILLCMVLVGGLSASGVLDTVFTRLFGADGKEMESRWDLAMVAWEMIRSHPLIGIGLNTFEETMIRFDPNHITHIIRQPVHNGFLLVAAETGIPALGLLLAMLWRQILLSGRILKREDELHFAVGLTGMVVFAGLGLANLFDVSLRKEPIAGLIVLTAAMVAAMAGMDEGITDSSQPNNTETKPS